MTFWHVSVWREENEGCLVRISAEGGVVFPLFCAWSGSESDGSSESVLGVVRLVGKRLIQLNRLIQLIETFKLYIIWTF